jgi:hypothetical protein
MAVAEEHHVLTQHPKGAGAITGSGREADRLPVAPEQLAGRCAGTDMGELGVF